MATLRWGVADRTNASVQKLTAMDNRKTLQSNHGPTSHVPWSSCCQKAPGPRALGQVSLDCLALQETGGLVWAIWGHMWYRVPACPLDHSRHYYLGTTNGLTHLVLHKNIWFFFNRGLSLWPWRHHGSSIWKREQSMVTGNMLCISKSTVCLNVQ